MMKHKHEEDASIFEPSPSQVSYAPIQIIDYQNDILCKLKGSKGP